MMRKAIANRRNGTTPRIEALKRERPERVVDAPRALVGVAVSATAVTDSGDRGGAYLTVAPTVDAQFFVIRSEALVIWSRVGSCVPVVSGSFAWSSAGTTFRLTMSS